MRSPHRVDIKAIIDELGRQAVQLQEQRLALIDEIRADPSYDVRTPVLFILSALTAAVPAWRAQCTTHPRRRALVPTRPQFLPAAPVSAECDRAQSHAAGASSRGLSATNP